MNIQSRKCANCAHFNSNPATDEPLCWNLVGIDQTDVFDGAVCEDHHTYEEDAQDWSVCDSYRRLGCDWAIPEYLASIAAARTAIRKASQEVQP